MNGSTRDLEGVHGTINMWDIWSEPGGGQWWIAQISAKRRGAAA